MSDTVLVALITLSGVLLTPIIAHILGRRDRALASEAVKTVVAELDTNKAAHAAEVAQLRSVIARQAQALAEAGVTTW